MIIFLHALITKSGEHDRSSHEVLHQGIGSQVNVQYAYMSNLFVQGITRNDGVRMLAVECCLGICILHLHLYFQLTSLWSGQCGTLVEILYS